MNKTAIEWCDYTWNPVTGCLHGCEYCYARNQANRFAGFEPRCGGETIPDGKGSYPKSIYNSTHGESIHIFHKQPMKRTKSGLWQKASYPYNFEPTFHRYRLDEPVKMKKPQNIFVCSMADLFGDWIPDEWIQEVFKICEAAPWHRYLFLTKNPERYSRLHPNSIIFSRNMWLGQTITDDSEVSYVWDYFGKLPQYNNLFLSIEPIRSPIFNLFESDVIVSWTIVGAETGNRKGKIIPKREWIENIVNECRASGVPIFMKNSLKDIWDGELIQEFPWEVL